VIERGLEYLATQQNPDGGFGDTDLSHSNIATTMLVRAALHLAEAASPEVNRADPELLERAARYIEAKGGIEGLRARYGKDKTFAVPILTNCALAGLVDWREVSPLPFELAAFPQSWYRFFRLPVVSYAIPALVAIGQARYFHCKPRNPLVRALRAASVKRTLNVLARMQPASGGYLEAVPLTSFVVMSLAGIGRADHPVARRGVKFLRDTARPDGSWPIDTNLATWVTTLAINAIEVIQSSKFQVQSSRVIGPSSQVSSPSSQVSGPQSTATSDGHATWDLGHGTLSDSVAQWLLSCQHNERHPFTGAAPGGWGWSDLSGAVPDADDTAGALLALARFADPAKFEPQRPHGPGLQGRVYSRVLQGICWLGNLQNRNGGWPTFCRGWGTLPFDRSSPDLTAHALRALRAWLPLFKTTSFGPKYLIRQIERGMVYLRRSQHVDGSWIPLWFGNQDHPEEENPIYGTSRVLLAYRDLQRMSDDAAGRGVRWLIANQNGNGGWGSGAVAASERRKSPEMAGGLAKQPYRRTDVSRSPVEVLNTSADCGSSVEETAWAVEGLLAGLDNRTLAVDNSLQNAIRHGVDWLVRAVEDSRHRQPAPVGFYFAKLWYYEKLYPLVFTVAALGDATRRLSGAVEQQSVHVLGVGRRNTE
jgi:squalene-hopene/tetraprenyl-beta-curcumene cyclase